MEKSVFNSKLGNAPCFTLADKADIQLERNRHPYCALLQAMALMTEKAADTSLWETRLLPHVVPYVNYDTAKLMRLLAAARIVEAAPAAPAATPAPVAPKPAPKPDAGAFDIMKEINSYQEVSFKTAPKSVILSNFLETGNYSEDDLGHLSDTPIEVLGKNSVRPSDSLETETLAVVLEKQGKYEKAVAIYEKLIARNPEKSSIFAARISELKDKIDNK